jgi:hypothetical protein
MIRERGHPPDDSRNSGGFEECGWQGAEFTVIAGRPDLAVAILSIVVIVLSCLFAACSPSWRTRRIESVSVLRN